MLCFGDLRAASALERLQIINRRMRISMRTTRVLFVCMGNICRSPTAEGVMRTFIREAGLENHIVVDSAGTHGYHVGEPPDPRAQAAARKRGYDLSFLRARQVAPEDFEAFDLLLAMDFNNLEVLQALCPPDHQPKLGLLMVYAENRAASIVHDPYYRSARDFDLVLDCIEDACQGLVKAIAPSEALMRHPRIGLARMPKPHV
jgi:protein-tyrosine phosphatase